MGFPKNVAIRTGTSVQVLRPPCLFPRKRSECKIMPESGKRGRRRKNRAVLITIEGLRSYTMQTQTRSLAVAKTPCNCCIILKSGSYTKAI